MLRTKSQSSTIRPAGSLKCGWLDKKCGRFGVWQPRYLVLQSDQLCWYFTQNVVRVLSTIPSQFSLSNLAKKKSGKPEGSVYLKTAILTEDDALVFTFDEGQEPISFRAPTEETKKEWVSLLQPAVKKLVELMSAVRISDRALASAPSSAPPSDNPALPQEADENYSTLPDSSTQPWTYNATGTAGSTIPHTEWSSNTNTFWSDTQSDDQDGTSFSTYTANEHQTWSSVSSGWQSQNTLQSTAPENQYSHQQDTSTHTHEAHTYIPEHSSFISRDPVPLSSSAYPQSSLYNNINTNQASSSSSTISSPPSDVITHNHSSSTTNPSASGWGTSERSFAQSHDGRTTWSQTSQRQSSTWEQEHHLQSAPPPTPTTTTTTTITQSIPSVPRNLLQRSSSEASLPPRITSVPPATSSSMLGRWSNNQPTWNPTKTEVPPSIPSIPLLMQPTPSVFISHPQLPHMLMPATAPAFPHPHPGYTTTWVIQQPILTPYPISIPTAPLPTALPTPSPWGQQGPLSQHPSWTTHEGLREPSGNRSSTWPALTPTTSYVNPPHPQTQQTWTPHPPSSLHPSPPPINSQQPPYSRTTTSSSSPFMPQTSNDAYSTTQGQQQPPSTFAGGMSPADLLESVNARKLEREKALGHERFY